MKKKTFFIWDKQNNHQYCSLTREKKGKKIIGEGERRNTVDVSGISKALYKFQLQQETLAPIIWIFIHILRPETQPILFPKKKKRKETPIL